MSTHNIYGYRDRQLLSRHYDRYSERYRERFPNFPPPLPSLSKIREVLDNPCPSPTLPVCIIGAGMAGLYTAMILQDLKIDYHIVDANTKERVGGRVFTYRFPGGDTYDYYVCRIPVFSHLVLIFAYRTLELCGSQIYHS